MATQRRFKGRVIVKDTVAIGVGGAFTRDPDMFPEPPPNARLLCQAWFSFDNIKHKFTETGKVEETLILTLDTSTFEVLEVTEPPPQPVQQQVPGTEDGDDGDD